MVCAVKLSDVPARPAKSNQLLPACIAAAEPSFLPVLLMNPDQFWTSQDGQILTVKNNDERTVTLTLAFWPRNPAEFEQMKAQLGALKFSERSSMARIGIEMLVHGVPHLEGNRVQLEVEAFIYDNSFPNAPYWK